MVEIKEGIIPIKEIDIENHYAGEEVSEILGEAFGSKVDILGEEYAEKVAQDSLLYLLTIIEECSIAMQVLYMKNDTEKFKFYYTLLKKAMEELEEASNSFR